jgi:predicted MFS family arabinose efflux permease
MTKHPSILSAPGARALLGSSILARLPLAMFSLALLVHARDVTGSYATAGLVSGAYAIASAVAAPVLGRLVDRRGQTAVLVGGAALTAAVLVAAGLLGRGTPAPLLIGLGAAAGLSTPPLDACMRTLLPAIADDPGRLPALFALESTVLELTFVAGPPLALGLGSVWSTGAALIACGAVILGGTLAFATRPASRRWRPDRLGSRGRGGSLRSPALRILVAISLGTGIVFGGTEVGVTAAAHALGNPTSAGALLGLWGAGSLVGGLVATRLGGGARDARGLIPLLGALAIAHGALILTTGSVVAIGVVIAVAGATIAPSESSIYAMVDACAPAGTQTEAYSWLVMASLVGASLGMGAAGALVQHAGAGATFALVGTAGCLAALAAVMGSERLPAIVMSGASGEAGGVQA